MIQKKDIEEARGTPIRSVAMGLGMSIVHGKCFCPFHADGRNPNGALSSRTNRFKCFSCGKSADTIGLTMQVKGMGFKEAVEYLLKEQGRMLEAHPPQVKVVKGYPPDVEFLRGLMRVAVINEAAGRFLYDERHYDPRVVAWLGLSSISQPTPCWRNGRPFYDAPSLLIPYRDLDGNVQNVQSRHLGNGASVPRFRFPPNGSIHAFNLPILRYLKQGDELWIAEGPSDTIAHLSAGHRCIGIPSASSLKPDDLLALPYFVKERSITLHCAPDNDSAGNGLYEKLSAACQRLEMPLTRHQIPTGYKDFSDYYAAVRGQHNNDFCLSAS